ncbi:MAG: C40 family peptidase [Silicimonas sp.]|nr:C40 family peptidase [Silicimonas sp.]
MTDRRLLAFSGRVADEALRGTVEAEDFVVPERMALVATHWLHESPDGGIDRELLFGDAFDVIERRGDWAFGRSAKDGYCGWVETAWLGPWVAPTHRIGVRTTWGYSGSDFKLPRILPLHMTSGVCVEEEQDGWTRFAAQGGSLWVPSDHVTDAALDMVTAARALLGTPYVWAGNSGFGIDCSGLVQVAMNAAGWACPGDSDLQEAMEGEALEDRDALEEGDLIFWKGHVAIATGPETMIHANAHHMMVVEEAITPAIVRIAANGGGPVTSRLRPERKPMVSN